MSGPQGAPEKSTCRVGKLTLCWSQIFHHSWTWPSQDQTSHANAPTCPTSGFSPAGPMSHQKQRKSQFLSLSYPQPEFPWAQSSLCLRQSSSARHTVDPTKGISWDSLTMLSMDSWVPCHASHLSSPFARERKSTYQSSACCASSGTNMIRLPLCSTGSHMPKLFAMLYFSFFLHYPSPLWWIVLLGLLALLAWH